MEAVGTTVPASIQALIDRKVTLEKAMAQSLTEREQNILTCRLAGMSAEDCGKRWRIGSERIRQITAKAVRKVRHKLGFFEEICIR